MDNRFVIFADDIDAEFLRCSLVDKRALVKAKGTYNCVVRLEFKYLGLDALLAQPFTINESTIR
jgi:hypothetical protein